MKIVESMRRDWNERALENAFHYIASWRKDWTPESFFESGERDYDLMVTPVLGGRGWDARDKTILELGCGAGRMTKAFAKRFGQVIALDISSEMLARAQALLPNTQNVRWVTGNGADLSGVHDSSVDFAFSYIVLQHMPTSVLAQTYIREMLRVLKQGGVFLFQYNGLNRPSMNLRGQIVWGAVDTLWSAGMVRASHGLASLLGLDPSMSGKSWRGAALDASTVRLVVESAGGKVETVSGERTAMAWCTGIKEKVQRIL